MRPLHLPTTAESRFGVLLILGVAAVVLLGGLPALANPSAEPAPPRSDVLIALPIPAPEPAEIPAGMDHEQAARFARQMTEQQAAPFLDELERLRSAGSITGFDVRPDLHGTAVTGAQGTAAQELSRLQGRGTRAAWLFSGEWRGD